jgi:hypothetical protein
VKKNARNWVENDERKSENEKKGNVTGKRELKTLIPLITYPVEGLTETVYPQGLYLGD